MKTYTRTYVTILRGKMRGKVGWIYGTLTDRKREGAMDITRAFVHFPSETFPTDIVTIPIAFMRDATYAERAWFTPST